MAVEAEAARHNKPWIREEDELLLELDEAGATRERMAMALGRTVNAIDSHLRELHLQLDNRPVCRNCVYYRVSGQWCYEWGRSSAPEQSCRRYRGVQADAGEVVPYSLKELERRRRAEQDARQQTRRGGDSEVDEPILGVLTVTEYQILGAIHKEMAGREVAVPKGTDLASRGGFERSTVNTALRLAQAAGVLRAQSRGSRGTWIQVLRPDVLARIAEEARLYGSAEVASG